MNSLDEIKNYLQSMSNIIDMDIGLLGKDRILLIGTGKYGKKIGSIRPQGCCFSKTAKTGEGYLISEPGQQSECLNCELLSKCPYSIVMSSPIFNGLQTMGTLGILGYKPNNASNIISKYHMWKEHMMELSKLLSKYTFIPNVFEARGSSEQAIKSALSLKKEGFIITDKNLNIIRIDQNVSEMLGGIDKVIGKKINEVIPQKIITELYDQQFGSVTFKPAKTNERLNLNLKNINNLGINNGVVIIFNSNYGNSQIINKEPMVLRKIIGNSPDIIHAKKLIKQSARTVLPVLIMGESGTGKELAAQAIHQLSSRHNKPLICINCAAIPDSLAESELFGYEGGAFTGAKAVGQKGKFELANGGTLFLDEVEELSSAVQAKLLRVIEKNEVYHIGGKTPIPLNVRIITATNVSLEQLIREGRFREDLYFRLNVFPLKMPSLRNNPLDIPILARHFLSEYKKNHSTVLEEFSFEVINVFNKFSWPGNVRQLKNVVEYLCATAKEPMATIEGLPYYITEYLNLTSVRQVTRTKNISITDIEHSLELFGNSTEGKKQAAQHLGVSLPTLYRKIKHLEKKRIANR